MTTNPNVNWYNAANEQDLIADLVVESIRFYGYDVQYIPRSINNRDPIFKEDSTSTYTGHFPIEMYIKSVDGYSGDGQFLAKFGIEVRHQITFTVAIRTWTSTTQSLTGFAHPFIRPLEGDLIYFGMDNKILQIKHVDQYGIFYQTGALQSYDLTCEVFEYSSEIFNTGIPAVDTLSDHYSLSTSEQGSIVDGKPVFNPAFDINNPYIGASADNVEIETDGDQLIDFSADNPFSLKF